MYAVYPGKVYETWEDAKLSLALLREKGEVDVRSRKFVDRSHAVQYSETGNVDFVERAAPARHVFTDGSCKSGQGSCGVYDPKTRLSWGWVLRDAQTSQRAELEAAKGACEALKGDLSLCVDSQYVIRVIEELIPCFRNTGHWENHKNIDILRLFENCTRGRTVRAFKVKGHSGNLGNDLAHSAAEDALKIHVRSPEEINQTNQNSWGESKDTSELSATV